MLLKTKNNALLRLQIFAYNIFLCCSDNSASVNYRVLTGLWRQKGWQELLQRIISHQDYSSLSLLLVEVKYLLGVTYFRSYLCLELLLLDITSRFTLFGGHIQLLLFVVTLLTVTPFQGYLRLLFVGLLFLHVNPFFLITSLRNSFCIGY